MSIDLDAMLGSVLPGYETRPEQARMAEAVREALAGGGRLLVEAGTGTGKSLAYLIPLAEHAVSEEERAVVSTYTKTLQRQLVEKELPFVREHVCPTLRFALSMGSENYLCLRRLEKATEQGLFPEETPELCALRKWAAETETGIREATPWELWHQVAREADLCTGKDCREYPRCFYQKAKERERRSHIIIVNHHLYFANLATGKRVLPPFETAVFDEAHELEDVAADYLGAEVSNFRVYYILRGILSPQGRGVLPGLKWLEPSDFSHSASLVEATRKHTEEFFHELSLRLEKPSVRIRQPGFVEDRLSESLLLLMAELDGLKESASGEEDKKELDAMARRCEAAAGAVRAILGQELEGHVCWAEKSGRRVRLAATPVDVAGMDVFQDLGSAVFTSATLSTGGSFQYIKERLGLYDADELLLHSPFDYREQAAVYIAADLPPPNTPGFEERAIERIREVLAITGGRTLVLFTSYSLLNRAADSMDDGAFRILRQGEGESYLLMEEFRADDRSALFGTYTFWQGIDVPGEALQCVVITKLPFQVPDEPVVEARTELLARQGRDPFSHYQVPRAAIMLKQGFGRLIRTGTDRGVVAILDSRIRSRWYGREFLRSLPECNIITSLRDMKPMLSSAGGQISEKGD
jgi:ATP-dependent DNA helicase DinG